MVAFNSAENSGFTLFSVIAAAIGLVGPPIYAFKRCRPTFLATTLQDSVGEIEDIVKDIAEQGLALDIVCTDQMLVDVARCVYRS